MASTLSEYEKYLKTVAQGQKDLAKAQLEEKQRQLDLAAKENERAAHEQIAQAKASGTIGAEQRRILDSMTGYGGSGAAVQRQIDAALSTDSATGRIHEALARARGDLSNQRASNLAAYNTRLLDIDNQVKAALQKAKYEQLVAAAEAERQRQQDALVAAQKAAEAQKKAEENPTFKGYTPKAFADAIRKNSLTPEKVLDTETAYRLFERETAGASAAFKERVAFELGLSPVTATPMSVAMVNSDRPPSSTTTGTTKASTAVPASSPAASSVAMANRASSVDVIDAQLFGLYNVAQNAKSSASRTKSITAMQNLIDAAFDDGKITADDAGALMSKYGLL